MCHRNQGASPFGRRFQIIPDDGIDEILHTREYHEEIIRENLTRKQFAERHGASSDRIIQWLCLLKLPEEKLREIENLGDYWEHQVVTERELRQLR